MSLRKKKKKKKLEEAGAKQGGHQELCGSGGAGPVALSMAP